MYEISAELIALSLIVVLLTQLLHRRGSMSSAGRYFMVCLGVNTGAILANLLTVYTIGNAQALPVWVNLVSNTLYYFLLFLMASCYMVHAARVMLAHVGLQQPLRVFHRVVVGSLAVLLALLGINLRIGIFFYMSETGTYERGPLWLIPYAQIALAMVCFGWLYIRHRARIDGSMRKVFISFLVFFPGIAMYQMLNPAVLTSGITGALVACILYMNLQTQDLDNDQLTKLPNRASFIRELEHRLKRDESFQLLLIELQHFGNINLEHGFRYGDDLLYSIARHLEKQYPDARIYRQNQVMFALLYPYHSIEQAERNVNELQKELPLRWQIGSHQIRIQPCFIDMLCSCGPCEPDVGGMAIDYSDIDRATVNAQLQEYIEYARTDILHSRCDVLHFDAAYLEKLRDRKRILDTVRSAIAEDRFEVWYQPIFCTGNRRFCSAEALLRLRLPDGSYMSPARFVPVAEESELMDSVNDVLWKRIGEFIAAHPELPVSTISVNMSIQQLRDPELVEKLETLHERYAIRRGMLTLEITERMLLTQETVVQNALNALLAKEYRFLLDDFGTGYSNFAAALQFPFSKIKLDRSLLYMIENDAKRLKTVEMLIELFHMSGMRVVAEGIETRPQMQAVLERGADFIQGYYYARPMPPEAYARFLDEHREPAEPEPCEGSCEA